MVAFSLVLLTTNVVDLPLFQNEPPIQKSWIVIYYGLHKHLETTHIHTHSAYINVGRVERF